MEEELAPLGVKVKWVETLGSNKTVEFLRGESLDLGSLAPPAALQARANGTPLKYVYWSERNRSGSPIMVREDSPIKTFEELRGKKIAATPGTGPHVSLLASLRKHGMTEDDVEIVSLPHSQGRVAMLNGNVDAWSGLEPDWSMAEIQGKARTIFADPDLAGGGGIGARDEIVANHPEVVQAVLRAFDRVRIETVENLDKSIADYAASSGLGEEIARSVITRTDISRPAVIPEDRQLLLNWGNLYKDFGTIPADADLEKIVDELLVYDLFKVAE